MMFQADPIFSRIVAIRQPIPKDACWSEWAIRTSTKTAKQTYSAAVLRWDYLCSSCVFRLALWSSMREKTQDDERAEEVYRLGVTLADSWEEAARRAAEERLRRMSEIRDITD
jgi:hypothetical protein